MITSRLARAAAKVLSQPRENEHKVSAQSRAAVTAAIRQALAAKAKRRMRQRWYAPAAAAAVLVATASAAIHYGRSAPEVAKSVAPAVVPEGLVVGGGPGNIVVVRSGARVAVRDGESVAFGETIAAEGTGTLRFATGTRIEIEPRSELVVDDRDGTQLVYLDGGAVTANVAKLAPNRRFIVRTTEADIEVRGTSFRVNRDEATPCGYTTTVRVAEGRVVARSAGQEKVLGQGDVWTSPCGASPSAPSVSSPAAAQVAPPRAPSVNGTGTVVRAQASAPPPEPRMAASNLATQNALFSEAMAEKGRGDTRGAVRALDDLLTRYPRTPLREAALAERMKLLARVDRAQAATAAKEYLAAYPNGFARVDAEAILPAP